jgi:hypothetical protein
MSWIDEKSKHASKEDEAFGGQRAGGEAAFAPPSYPPPGGEASSSSGRPASPPPMYGHAAPTGYAPPSGPPPSGAFQPPPGPPPAAAAPAPGYEPFDFRAAYSASTGGGKGVAQAPPWHGVPSYLVDPAEKGALTLRTPPPPRGSVPCLCGAGGDSGCLCSDDKGPMWRTAKEGSNWVLQSWRRDQNAFGTAVVADKSLTGSKAEVKDAKGKKVGVTLRFSSKRDAVFNE